MGPSTRREVLQHGVVAGSLVITGCTRSSNDDSAPSETTTAAGATKTETGTATTIETTTADTPATDTDEFDGLGHTASITAQPSDQQPAELRLLLEHDGNETITVNPFTAGRPLEDVGPVVGEQGEGVLLPRNTDTFSIAGGEIPDTPTNGCWRFEPGETGTIEWDMAEYYAEIEPEETYAVEHGVYYDGPEDACFPAGNYRTEYNLEFIPQDGESRIVEFECVLKVDASGTFSATVK